MAGKAGKSGRQSAEAENVVRIASSTPDRPEPPSHLNNEQSAEWRAVVDACPADWFPRETHGALESYCRHTIAEREIDQMVEDLKELGLSVGEMIGGLDKLYKMRERESRAAVSCATKLRITNQALTNHKASRTPGDGGGGAKKPWES
jgi:hypothetical protein